MARFNYHEEQTKGLSDFYAYCDVMNYHLDYIDEWKSGIALCTLGHGMAIFNGHNNKGYVFYSDAPESWVKEQYLKCVAKYACDKATADKIKNENMNKLERLVAEIRARDL